MVNVYSEPILDVTATINQWFGHAYHNSVYDISILFSYLFLFVFALSLFGLLFKRFK